MDKCFIHYKGGIGKEYIKWLLPVLFIVYVHAIKVYKWHEHALGGEDEMNVCYVAKTIAY